MTRTRNDTVKTERSRYTQYRPVELHCAASIRRPRAGKLRHERIKERESGVTKRVMPLSKGIDTLLGRRLSERSLSERKKKKAHPHQLRSTAGVIQMMVYYTLAHDPQKTSRTLLEFQAERRGSKYVSIPHVNMYVQYSIHPSSPSSFST